MTPASEARRNLLWMKSLLCFWAVEVYEVFCLALGGCLSCFNQPISEMKSHPCKSVFFFGFKHVRKDTQPQKMGFVVGRKPGLCSGGVLSDVKV